MAPLTAVISAALAAEGVTADPAACKLLLGKRELDTATPLRFANLPTGAKLQLVTGAAHCCACMNNLAACMLHTPCALIAGYGLEACIRTAQL